MLTPTIWRAPYIVNTTTTSTQYLSQVAAAADSSFFEVWSDSSSGTSHQTIRHFDAFGNPLTGEVNLVGGNTSYYASTVVLANQQIDTALSYYSGSGSNYDTYVGVTSPDLPGSISFHSVEGTATESLSPSLAGFADSGMFVAYESVPGGSSNSILANSISPNGIVGAPITIASTNLNYNPHVAALDNQNVAVVYQHEFTNGGSDYDIRFQILSETGAVVKADGVVLGAGSGAVDQNPDVTALHSGGFLVTWSTTTGSSATYDIHGVVYDRDGNVVRSDFIVNTSTAGNQDYSHATALDDGGFLVGWHDFNTNDDRVQRFDAAGNKLGQEIVVHTGSIFATDLTTLADGRVVESIDHYNGGDYDVEATILDTRTNVTGHATGHDLFGDGTSDTLILRSATANNGPGGLLTMYDLSATSQLTQIGQIGDDWSVSGSGDFNGDGRSDILMQHDNAGFRDIYSFTMGAGQVTAITKLGTVGLDWQIDGSGDFDGDGFKDILLERVNNGAKELDIIGMKSGAVNSITVAGALTPSTYQVDGIGDLNKDGKADILTHYDDASGRHFVELDESNNTTQAVKGVATIGTEWNAAGMGDFNGDGYADILIHKDTASARDLGFLINQGGNGWVFKDLGPIVGKNVQIDGIGDFNGDGTADISAHYDTSGTSRTDIYFEMHTAAITDIHTTGTVGHEWIVS